MAVTDTWKRYAAEAVFKGVPVNVATFYIGLGNAEFSVGTEDAAWQETTGSGYTRLPAQWSDFVADMSNTNTIIFSVTGGWAPVEWAFVADAAQGGHVLAYDEFATKYVTTGDTVSINPGDFILT